MLPVSDGALAKAPGCRTDMFLNHRARAAAADATRTAAAPAMPIRATSLTS
jgi:hypothetical protein